MRKLMIPAMLLLFVHSALFARTPAGFVSLKDCEISETPYKGILDSSVVFTEYHGGELPLFEGDDEDLQGGIYLFKAHFQIPDSLEKPTLFIPPSPYAIKIVVNNHTIYEWGNGEKSKTIANYRAETVILHDEILDTLNQFQLFFYTDGAKTALKDFWIGSFEEIEKKAFWVTFFNHTLISGIVLVSLFVSLVFFINFIMAHEKVWPALVLSCSALTIVGSYIFFPMNASFFDQVVLLKVARVSNLILPFTLFLFVFLMSHLKGHKGLQYIIGVSMIAFFPLVVEVMTATTKHEINVLLNNMLKATITPIMLVTIILLISMVVNRKNRGVSIALFASYLFFLVAGMRDMSYLLTFNEPMIWYIPYGYLLTILGNMIALIYVQLLEDKKIMNRIGELIQEKENIQDKYASEFSVTREMVLNLYDELFSVRAMKEQKGGKQSDVVRYNIELAHAYYALHDNDLSVWYESTNLQEIIDAMVALFPLPEYVQTVSFLFEELKNGYPQSIWADEKGMRLILFAFLSAIFKRSEHGTVEFAAGEEQGGLVFQIFGTGHVSSDGFTTEIEGRASGNINAIEQSRYLSIPEIVACEYVHLMDGTVVVDTTDGVLIRITLPLKIVD